jgi:hypothetical protein
MYVRKKFVRRGETTYGPYWQVVRSTRANGKPRQKVIANVGVAETRGEADNIARAKGLLCGVKGCGEAAAVEPECRGFVPTYTLKLAGGREREYPYLMCFAHVEDYRRGNLYPTVPLLLRD